MTIFRIKRFSSRIQTFVKALSLICWTCAAHRAVIAGTDQPSGRAAETWACWEAFNKAAVSGVGIEVLQAKAYDENVTVQDTCGVLADIISGERERSRAITALPVLHVDPDLTTYAVEFAKSRLHVAAALEDFVSLARKQEELTSAPALGVGLLFNLLNHSDDKEDGILLKAMLDEGRQTAENLATLKEPVKAFEKNMSQIRTEVARLETEEMKLRSKLAQQFDKEFPPMRTYARAGTSVEGDKDLSSNEIIESLIGHKIGEWSTWSFESPQEFVSLKILNVTNRTELLTDYLVETHVKGIRTGQEHDFRLGLRYGRLYTRWKLVKVKALDGD
jgi:hypothetical protein